MDINEDNGSLFDKVLEAKENIMSLNDILKIALTIIGCFGGVGAIVSATVKFTSEKIAERLEKKYELRLNKELEELI